MNRILLTLTMSLLFIAPSAFAANDEKGDWSLGAYFGGGFPDDYQGINPDVGPLFGLRSGFAFTDDVSAEISLHRVFSNAGTSEANFDSYRLNVLWNLQKGKQLRPFLTAGAGVESVDFVSADLEKTNIAPNIGGGLKWFASDHGGLRFDGRYVPVKVGGPIDSWEHNFETFVSVFFTFGTETPAPVTKVVVVEKTTPATDSDHDGVIDFLDKCPGTPAGTQVDSMGCPSKAAKARGVLKGVNFKSGKAELTEDAKKVLDDVAATLNEFPAVKAEVQGHTDNTGSEQTNSALSAARAETVKNYLIAKGVAKERLTSKGYGSSQPMADNKTKEGRTTNRRVELKWVD